MPPNKNLSCQRQIRLWRKIVSGAVEPHESKPQKNPEKNIGSNHILRNREFVFTPKIEYELAAERSEANQNSLTFPFWSTFIDDVRTSLVAKTADIVKVRTDKLLNNIRSLPNGTILDAQKTGF